MLQWDEELMFFWLVCDVCSQALYLPAFRFHSFKVRTQDVCVFGWNSLSLPLCLIFFALCGGFWRKCLPCKCACVCVYVYLSACTHAFRWPQGLLRVHWTEGWVRISHCGGKGSLARVTAPLCQQVELEIQTDQVQPEQKSWSRISLNNHSRIVRRPQPQYSVVLKVNKCECIECSRRHFKYCRCCEAWSDLYTKTSNMASTKWSEFPRALLCRNVKWMGPAYKLCFLI